MLTLCDIDDLPPPLKALYINSMELPTTASALEYLDTKLRPILKRLTGEVDTSREQYAIHKALLCKLLEEHEVRSADHALALLIGLELNASDDEVLDALAGEFETAHACMRMHEDVDALRELVDNAKLARLDVEISVSMRNLVLWLWRRVRSARRPFVRLRRRARPDILETASERLNTPRLL